MLLLPVEAVVAGEPQTVVKLYLEPDVEPIFHADSYGYRPGRSAHDALRVCRERCWSYDWAIDLDVRAFFDSLDHELALRAVAHHSRERWILLYVKRWLKAPLQRVDGTLVARDRGTPQGSAISPLIANIFLHYALVQDHIVCVALERDRRELPAHPRIQASSGSSRIAARTDSVSS